MSTASRSAAVLASVACAGLLAAAVAGGPAGTPAADPLPRSGDGHRLAELVDPSAPCVRAMAAAVLSARPAASPEELAQAASDLVRTSVAYARDVGGDHWQTPAETAARGAGDCEDASVLAASLLLALGIRCCLLLYDHHVAVGASLDAPSGHRLRDGDDVWTYIEATGGAPLPIGSVPRELAGARCAFVHID